MKTKKRKIIKNGKNKRTQKAGIRLNQNISHDSKFKPIFHNDVYNYNKQNNINNNTLADQAEEELKQINPEKYNEIMNSIKETLEEEKQNPRYIKALFANQMNGLIDPTFILPVNITNNSNNLTLIMD